MIRPIATEIGLFLAPFLLYAVFLWGTRAGVTQAQNWPLPRLLTLCGAGLMLMLGSFLYFAHFGGAPVGSEYVPAHVDDSGRFVPGQMRR